MWKQLNENMKCHQVQRQSSQRVTRGEQIFEEKTKKSPSNCTQTAWSFFQTCGGFFVLFVLVLVFGPGEGNGEGRAVAMFLQAPPHPLWHCLEATELRVQMCWGWRLALWHSRPRCHGDLKQGPGASSTLTPWGRRPGVWSSAVFPHYPPSSGDQVDSGGSCPWPSVSTALEAFSGDAPPNPFVWPTTYT